MSKSKSIQLAAVCMLLALLVASCSGPKERTICWRDGATSGVAMYKRNGHVDCKKGYTPEWIIVQ